MITANDLLEKIRSDFVPGDEPIDGRTELLISGLIDSLAVVNLVAWIEDRVGQAINPSDVVIENFETVDAMAALVGRMQGIDA